MTLISWWLMAQAFLGCLLAPFWTLFFGLLWSLYTTGAKSLKLVGGVQKTAKVHRVWLQSFRSDLALSTVSS